MYRLKLIFPPNQDRRYFEKPTCFLLQKNKRKQIHIYQFLMNKLFHDFKEVKTVLQYTNINIYKYNYQFGRQVCSFRLDVFLTLVNSEALFQQLMPLVSIMVHLRKTNDIYVAVVHRCFVKKVFLEISQVFSCEFCEISKSTFLHKTPLVAASVYSAPTQSLSILDVR